MTLAAAARTEMLASLLTLAPFDVAEPFRIVQLATGDGRFTAALLECFPHATVLALEGSEDRRAETMARTNRFGSRVSVRAFDLASLEWWDLLRGADLVCAVSAIHRLNDAKKQYLYKAVAERVSARGALLIADAVAPQHPIAERQLDESMRSRASDEAVDRSPLFFQLVWLKHAGFAIVDCFWAAAGHAVYGGFKTADAPLTAPLTYAEALKSLTASA